MKIEILKSSATNNKYPQRWRFIRNGDVIARISGYKPSSYYIRVKGLGTIGRPRQTLAEAKKVALRHIKYVDEANGKINTLTNTGVLI